MAWRRHVVKQHVAARLALRREAEAAQRAATEAQQRQEETFEVGFFFLAALCSL